MEDIKFLQVFFRQLPSLTPIQEHRHDIRSENFEFQMIPDGLRPPDFPEPEESSGGTIDSILGINSCTTYSINLRS